MNDGKIARIAVVGAGMMGHAIAQEFAQNRFNVVLIGRSQEKLRESLLHIKKNLIEMVDLSLIHSNDIAPALDKIETTTSTPEGVAEADLIIEAIIEDLDQKCELLHQIESACPKHSIIASNTSSIMPSFMADTLDHPERFLITHYFNPPYLMPLVEIVPGPKTDQAAMGKVYELYISMGKKPIKCIKEAPGFIANRIQMVIWREAFNIVQKGIATPQEVDMAVKYSFGRRFGVAGPFEIFEHNDGYDLTVQIEKYMLPDMDTSPEHYNLLLEKVSKGELGAKSGKGFYDWTESFTQRWRSRMNQNLVEHRRRDLSEN